MLMEKDLKLFLECFDGFRSPGEGLQLISPERNREGEGSGK